MINGIDASLLNDDRLTKTLDAIHPSLGVIKSEIALNVAQNVVENANKILKGPVKLRPIFLHLIWNLYLFKALQWNVLMVFDKKIYKGKKRLSFCDVFLI
ncbi:MAG: hypothetical protein AB1595_07110 [bacterium]